MRIQWNTPVGAMIDSTDRRFTIEKTPSGLFILTDIGGEPAIYQYLSFAKKEAERRAEDDAHECASHAWTGQ